MPKTGGHPKLKRDIDKLLKCIQVDRQPDHRIRSNWSRSHRVDDLAVDLEAKDTGVRRRDRPAPEVDDRRVFDEIDDPVTAAIAPVVFELFELSKDSVDAVEPEVYVYHMRELAVKRSVEFVSSQPILTETTQDLFRWQLSVPSLCQQT